MSHLTDRVSTFFNDKTLLITGGTGFVGKVLIEKLLRSCTDLRRIYVLIRNKKGKSGHERLEALFKTPLFNKIREEIGEKIFHKVEAINGDIQYLKLGISPEDRKKLCEEVEVIYHSAATVRFDESLKVAVLLNVRGTREMLQLAKECQKLLVFNHVSTAYCQVKEDILLEKLYPPPADPHQVIASCEWMSQEALQLATKALLGIYPNTYSFTKALAEGLIREEFSNLPIIVTRPTIVVPIWKEPIPGWTDNLNGPTGLLAAGAKGIVWSVFWPGAHCCDYLPVDICASGLVCSSADFIINKSVRRVFNFGTSNNHKYSLDELISQCTIIARNTYPLGEGIWHAGGTTTNCIYYFYLKLFFLQIIPAVFIDLICLVLGKKTFLLNLQKKIYKGQFIMRYFVSREWIFEIGNVRDAIKTMNEKEKILYNMDDCDFDFYEYLETCAFAGRKYFFKRPEDTLKRDLINTKIMLFIDKVVVVVFIIWILYMFLGNFIFIV